MKNLFANLLVFLFFVAMIAMAAIAGYSLAFRNLVFPRVLVSGIEVSGLDRDSATKLINKALANSPSEVSLRFNGKVDTKFEDFKISYDPVWAVDQALNIGRSGNWVTQITERIKTAYYSREITLPVKYDTDEFNGFIDQYDNEVSLRPVWPGLKINKDGSVTVVGGRNGLVLKKDDLKNLVTQALATPGKHLIDAPMEVQMVTQDESLSKSALEAATKWKGKKLVISYKDLKQELSYDQIISLFDISNKKINSEMVNGLVDDLRAKFEVEPKDAVLSFENNRVKEFKPEVVGTKINKDKLTMMLSDAIWSVKENVEIPMELTYPKISAAQINDLGINELIGRGNSSFFHSIPGRIFNVNLAASRINGVIVAPGEEFSFNNSVGEISRATGYQTAYVISGGKTVLGDGGGVCQVSTTLFRAVLNAGLPVTERKAHAYRVGYYEQDSKPGIDATVYYPSADFKFVNDTGKHILIQTEVDTKNLKMKIDIYGTSDGRKASISTPLINSQTPPPPTVYVDDPTLKVGQTKQIDWSAWGAKVSFNYKVERGGETLFEKTFFSNYQPWQAVYLRGTATN